MDTDRIKTTLAVFNSCAFEYEQKFMDTSMYHDSFDLFCSAIQKKDPEILDVACGPGNIMHYLLQKRNDLKILGIDIAPNMLVLAKKNNPSAEFELLDSRNILSLNKKYDAIICGFCLPYLSKAEAIQFIKDASTLLHPSGVLYLSTMEDEHKNSGLRKSSSGEYETFINFHEADYLTNALRDSGFSILNLLRKQSYSGDGSLVIDLILLAKK